MFTAEEITLCYGRNYTQVRETLHSPTETITPSYGKDYTIYGRNYTTYGRNHTLDNPRRASCYGRNYTLVRKAWEVELDTLREQMVGTEDTAYTIFYDFKRYVLEPAVKELQDIGWLVTWKPQKVGKKVGRILFTIPKHIITESTTGPQIIDITPKGRQRQKQSEQLTLGILSEMPTLHQRIVARLQKLQVTDAQIQTVLKHVGDDEAQYTKLLKSTHQLLVNYETKSKVFDNIGGVAINLLKTEIPGLFTKL